MTESEKPLPASKRIPPSSNQLHLHKQSLGRSGESTAAEFLIQHNFQLLARNIRFRHGEIDLVFFDPLVEEVVFVEVKTRSSGLYGDPSLAVTKPKLRALMPVALAWMKRHPEFEDFRFDVVSVLPGQIQHFRNVTW